MEKSRTLTEALERAAARNASMKAALIAAEAALTEAQRNCTGTDDPDSEDTLYAEPLRLVREVLRNYE